MWTHRKRSGEISITETHQQSDLIKKDRILLQTIVERIIRNMPQETRTEAQKMWKAKLKVSTM